VHKAGRRGGDSIAREPVFKITTTRKDSFTSNQYFRNMTLLIPVEE